MPLNPLFPALWSARITYFAGQFSAFLPNATRQWEGEAVYGNTIKIPTVARDVTMKNYNRADDLDAPEDIDATTQDLSIDQEHYFSFKLEDLDSTQSRIGGSTLIDLKSQGAGLAVARVVDSYVGGRLLAIPNGDLMHNEAPAEFDLKFTSALKKNLTIAGLLHQNTILVTTPEVIETVDEKIIDRTYGDYLASNRFGGNNAQDPQLGAGFAMVLNGFRTFVSVDKRLRTKADGSAIGNANRSVGMRSLMFAYNPMDLPLVQQVNKVETYRLEKRFATGVKGLTNFGSKVLDASRISKFTFSD